MSPKSSAASRLILQTAAIGNLMMAPVETNIIL